MSFLSIDAVGSELWTALHEYINGDTHKSVFDNSSPVSFPTASSTACCSRPFLTCGFEASSLACCLALALVLQREHIPDFPCASLSQLATPQREPPPCFPHRSVVPRARLPQPATLQRHLFFRGGSAGTAASTRSRACLACMVAQLGRLGGRVASCSISKNFSDLKAVALTP